MKGQDKSAPLLSNPNLEETLLNAGQTEAIANTLKSTDTHQIIHGLSGVGKTTALGVLREQLKGTGIEIQGFSPTIEAAAKLQEELNIKTNTVAHLVLSKPKNKPNQLWIIDEAGMMSANQMEAIAFKADKVGARILLVGDRGQNSSVEAGSPLRSLIDHGATTHSISQILRQQNTIQKQAVELIAEGNGTAALELLNDHGYVTEIEDRKERARSVAKQYLELSEKERDKTLIVTGTNFERLSITEQIRKGLKAEGKLGESVKAVQLVSRNLSKEQSAQINNYEVGDYIKLHREYKGTPLQKGKLYKVEGIKGNELLISSYGGRSYRLDPSKFRDKQVFTSGKIELAVGERLRWTAGADKHLGQINGKQVTVTSFNSMSMNVMDNQGKTQEVSLLQPWPLDYNLVSTSYRAQGKSKKRVIVSATNDPTSSLEPFYVKISRQTKDLTVYTQDLEKLRGWVERKSAQQNPLELIEQHYGNQRRTHERNLESHPTESRTTRTTRDKRNSKFSHQREDVNQHSENPLSSSGRTESVYPTVDRSPEQSQQQRDKRIHQGINQRDSVSLHQDSRHQPNLFGYEADNRGISEQLRYTGEPQQLTGLEELAQLIANTQVEAELVEALSQVKTYLQEFQPNLQLEQLETVARALTEWEVGQELADTVLHSLETEPEHLEVLLPPIQSHNFFQPEIQQLVTAIEEWLGALLPEYQFQGMEELARAISEQQAHDALALHLELFNDTSRQLKDLVNKQLDQLKDYIAEHPTINQSSNPELRNLGSSIEDKDSCFKPDNFRIDDQKSAERGTPKYRKYENPASSKRVPFLPEVSERLANKIYQKHDINPTSDERESGFWYVVKQYPQIPITITEGFKKTLASLSQGEVTIGLTGVNQIYRSRDDDKNKLPQRELNPDVAVFVSPEREFRLAYDQDTKAKTIVNVRRALVRGIELLEAKGCQVKVVKWNPEDGKGLDDLISQTGAAAYAEAHRNAVSSDKDKKIHYRTEYNKLAKQVRKELGAQISDERLDLEVYIRAVLKGEKADGTRVVGESDFSRLLKKEKPQFAQPYLQAISHVAGTYQRLSENNTPKLDFWAKKMVKQQTAKFKVKQEEVLKKTPQLTKHHGLSL